MLSLLFQRRLGSERGFELRAEFLLADKRGVVFLLEYCHFLLTRFLCDQIPRYPTEGRGDDDI